MRYAAILTVLLLAGCASASQWTRVSGPDQAKLDYYECKREAHGSIVYGMPLLQVMSAVHARSVLNECMEARGYQKQ